MIEMLIVMMRMARHRMLKDGEINKERRWCP